MVGNARLPSPSEVVQPLTQIESSIISAFTAPPRMVGLPQPPTVTGPVAFVQRILSTLPAPRLFN